MFCQVAIKWEVQRAKEEAGGDGDDSKDDTKRALGLETGGLQPDPKKPKMMPSTPGCFTATATTEISTGENKPVEKQHADNIVNYLLRLACQVSKDNHR